MARLKIAALGRLRAFDDTFEVEDSLGLGITFVLARRDCREHVDWRQRRASADPMAKEVSKELFAAIMDIGDEAKPKAGSAEVPVDGEPTATAADAIADRIDEAAIVRRLVGENRLSAMDVLGGGKRDQLEEAIALVRGWSGAGTNDADTGKPVPCTPENVRSLLTSDAEFVEGEHEGKTLGEVLPAWIIEKSSERTRLARRIAEEASKASAPPSGS